MVALEGYGKQATYLWHNVFVFMSRVLLQLTCGPRECFQCSAHVPISNLHYNNIMLFTISYFEDASVVGNLQYNMWKWLMECFVIIDATCQENYWCSFHLIVGYAFLHVIFHVLYIIAYRWKISRRQEKI